MTSLRSAVLAALLVAAGCVPRVVPPTEALDLAVAEVANGSGGARALALAGFSALLIEANVDEARTHFDSALAKDPAEPYALTGQRLLAQRVGDHDRALTAALDLLERQPRHPLSVAAARFTLDHATVGRRSDDVILARAPALLAKSLSADGAHLLRSAVVAIHQARSADAAATAMLDDMGVPRRVTLVGPMAAWHVLSLAEPTRPEQTGSLEALGDGPLGPLAARTLSFPDGRLSLAGESGSADVYLVAVDVDVPEAGAFVLRTITSMDHLAQLDGTQVISRVTWRRPASTLSTQAVRLTAGTHRLLIKATREDQAGNL
jgi:cellulose synthase operon protein C